jgi:hypothetical protein
MIIYVTKPIDDWWGWQRPEDVFRHGLNIALVGTPFRSTGQWHELWDRAQHQARKAFDWDGEIREGPFISVLPHPESGGSEIIIAWKQDNSGTTFIVSPFRLPWVEAEETTRRMIWMEA